MCAVDAYSKEHIPIPDYASSGGDVPIPSTSSKESLISLGQKINFIDNWLQCFEDSYDNKIFISRRNMSELFKTIPKLLPAKKPDEYKTNYQTTIKTVGVNGT